MTVFRKAIGWLVAALLGVWGSVLKVLDWIGRSTIPEDWSQLMDKRLPTALSWLFTTPWWVPSVLATALTIWLMWWSWPQRETVNPAGHKRTPNTGTAPKATTESAPVQVPAAPRPLTQHAAERKLKIVDRGLDMLKEVQPIIDQRAAFMRDEWHAGKMGNEIHSYPDRVQALIAEIRSFAERVDALRNENQEYQDVMQALQQSYFNDSVEQLAQYMNACREVETAVRNGAPRGSMNFMFSGFVSKFEQALKRLEDWRNRARGDLGNLRSKLSND